MNSNNLYLPALLRQALALCFAMAAWGILCTQNAVLAAGCAHASATQQQHGARDGVDPALLGKWQYVGGKVYYLFHPSPTKCDGPGCRQAPEPGSEMTIIPKLMERTVVPAHSDGDRLFAPHDHHFTIDLEDLFVLSPVLSGILRPPMA